jgi:hypothetical protein
MRIVFSLRHPGALRNFGSTLDELARRGHELHLVFMTRDKTPDARPLADLMGRYPGMTATEMGRDTPWNVWRPLARDVRTTLDYLRYLEPVYDKATPLRARAARRVPARMRAVLDAPLLRGRAGTHAAAAILRQVERAIPTDPKLVRWLAERRPDVVLATPVVELGSDQVEYLKAARALGIPAGVCVHSWDNLTSKGLIRGGPDGVFVWNETQKREAIEMHGLEPARVTVTGAPVYDQWFARQPGSSREAFCSRIGLPPERPFFLYLCSSQFVAAGEAAFIEEWVRSIRAAEDPRVREAGILIRPHPRMAGDGLRQSAADRYPNTVIWPRGGDNPVDPQSKTDYFDSLYHSVAAVGINTSAQIEAAIVGRPVYSIHVPESVGAQDGTLHFRYLLAEHGGPVRLDDTLDAHVRALAGAFDERAAASLRAFVEHFVRPHGLDVAATPLLADGIEALARSPRRAPATPGLGRRLVQRACYPVATALARSQHPGDARRARPVPGA